MEQANTSGASSSVVTPLPKTTTADDLLAMYDAEVSDEAKEVDGEAAKQAKIAEELPKKIAANNIAKKLEAKSEDSGAELEEPKGDLPEGEKGEAEDEAEEDIKAYKAKFEDEEFEVPEDAVIPAELNGKTINVKVKDAVQALVNQEKWNRELDRRLSVVSDREKRFGKERDDIQNRLKQVVELAQQGDHVMGIRVLAEMAGKDPVEYEKEVLGTLDKLMNVYSTMTEDQKAAYFASRKAEYLEKKLKERDSEVQFSASKEQLRAEVDSLRKEHKLSEEEFMGYYKELIQLGFTPQEATPNAVVEHHYLSKHVQKVGQAISKVNKALAQNSDFVNDLIAETKSNRDYTVEDIEKIIRDVLSIDSKSIENLNRKVQKAQVHGGPRAQSGQASSEKKQAEVREDDELYEHFFGKAKVSARR
ncbi:MAG: hypothetical protein E6Q97_36225 [Desulfurellales bacterium]|nr:MAG: hypothetical protein E6Q97_36225 [Desulfurellales bacterium]